ncbi:TadE family type IV pilus minor pilin [Actinomycetospora soli]|uniref:TadE family type IV pilus minor pilin n=1 Tax=Actinomycetospora soli TaxID=2893887 RepID=UPI001E3DED85|nr:TadE family type IV pilus minor pilin [Actinomycetospora soli]MCD2189928.1 pilus assembly protein [Actinomycetospora soli]
MEAAIVLGALVLVFAVVLAGLGAVVARIRCVDAAGEAARRAARDDVAGARALATELPAGTELTVTVEGDTVVVRVAMPPLGGALRALRVTAEAVAAREPAVAATTGVVPDGAPTDRAPDPTDADPTDADPADADPPGADPTGTDPAPPVAEELPP